MLVFPTFEGFSILVENLRISDRLVVEDRDAVGLNPLDATIGIDRDL